MFAFGAVTLLGTLLLMLPIARAGEGRGTPFVDALFHATSAVCVTGLNALDTADHWSAFGKVVLLLLVQAGGLGIMSFASILGLLVARRLGLRARLNAATESGADVGDVRRLLLGVAKVSLVIEGAVALVLAGRFWIGYDHGIGEALWLGVFHGVSAFNNAGFALWSDGLERFVSDAWVCLPIAGAVLLGSVGFPVLRELRREFGRPLHWSMNTKIVLSMTLVLVAAGALLVTALEWGNPATLAPLDPGGRLLAGLFQGVMPRSAGLATVDVGQMDPVTWLVTDVLMFIGGGPAGTAGGIKVTTFAVLLFIVWTEVRGDGAVNIFGKRLPRSVQRQAIAVATFAIAIVVVSTMTLMLLEGLDLDHALFEVTSAFTTTGLSTGVTAELSDAGQLLLTVLMFVGRLGPITFASAIALRRSRRLYEFPKERPIIG